MDIVNYGVFSLFFIQVSPLCTKEPIPNGVAVISEEPYNSVHYDCNEGFELFGAADSYCFGDVWATPVPLCHAKGCNMAGYTQINNGYIEIISNGSLLVVTCYPGFIMDGKSTISCDGKEWSEPLPNCYSAVEINSCNFEHNSFCGWTQGNNDFPDWTLRSGETETKRTGPSFDHTFGQSLKTGHYIYMEASIPRQYGHISRLVSPVYSRRKSRRCFQLWYHMLGPDEPEYMGNLMIFLRLPAGSNHIEEELFSVYGNQGDTWHKAEVFIPLQDDNFQIVVQATRGHSHTSDIAVDDFRFFRCTNDSEIDMDIIVESSSEATNNYNTSDNSIYNVNTEDPISNTEVLEDFEKPENINKTNDNEDSLTDTTTNATSVDTAVSSTEYIPIDIPEITHFSPSPSPHTTKIQTFAVETENSQTQEKNYLKPWVVQKKSKVETATENLAVYPMDIGQNSNHKNDKIKSSFNFDGNIQSTTLESIDSKLGENRSILFSPVFIGVIVGVCSLVIISVVVVSILVVRRRRIWGRKTSDDQIQVLYHKNMLQTQVSQNI